MEIFKSALMHNRTQKFLLECKRMLLKYLIHYKDLMMQTCGKCNSVVITCHDKDSVKSFV